MNKPFLNSARINGWARATVSCYLFILIILTLSADGINGINGKPVGTDFITFYSASKFLQNNTPEKLYEPAELYPVQKQLAGEKIEFYAWHYPPPFSMLIYPLSRTNYISSWVIWLVLTIIPFLYILKSIYQHHLAIIIFLAFPGTFQNIIHGQNGFLTAFLLGTGLWLVSSKPFAAGIILGGLLFKPHFTVLIIPALIAGKHYRTLFGMAVSMLFLFTLTVCLWGLSPWYAFLHNLEYANYLLESGALPHNKMPTPLVAILILGVSIKIARVVQFAISLFSLAAVVFIWKTNLNPDTRSVALIVASPIVTPFAFDYDLTILGIAIAHLLASSKGDSYKRRYALILWILPFLAPFFAFLAGIQIAPLILFLILAGIVYTSKSDATSIEKAGCLVEIQCPSEID